MEEAAQSHRELAVAMDVIVKLQEENRVLGGQVKGLLLQTANLKAAAMRVVGRSSPARQKKGGAVKAGAKRRTNS